ncbi:MAG TPA: hypothetical protein VGA00_03555 [Acidiferrobacterales bacterium]
MRRVLHVLVNAVAALLVSACAPDLQVRPELAPAPLGTFRLAANVVFDGNRDYLPRTLRHETSTNAGITAHYQHEVAYGNTDLDAIALYNPLTIVGFPTGQNTLTIVAELKVSRDGALLKSYRAVGFVVQTTNLWTFRTATELRRDGLLAVRDNIETQMIHDEAHLEQLVRLQ